MTAHQTSTAQRYDITGIGHALQQGIVLTPTRRLARQVKAAWDDQQQRAGALSWTPAPVASVEDWLLRKWHSAILDGQLPPRALLESNAERLLWRQCIEALEMSSVAPSLINRDGAAAAAQQARDTLLRFKAPYTSEALRQRFGFDADGTLFLHWLDAFEQRCSALGFATAADALTDLCTLAPGSDSAIFLLETDTLAPLVEHCLQHLGQSLEVLPVPQPFAGASVNASQRKFPDKASELATAARWMREQHHAAPDARVAIVLPRMDQQRDSLLYYLRREFDALGDNYSSLPVNVSAGIPMLGVPIVRDALRVLAFSAESVAAADVVALSQSRFLQVPDTDSEAFRKLLRRLHRSGQLEVTTAELRNECRRAAGEGEPLWLGEQLLAIGQLREWRKSALPSTWLIRIQHLLAQWGWPGGPLDSLEYQQLGQWQEVTARFAALDTVLGELELNAAVAALRQLLAAAVSQPASEDSPLQVLGALEAEGLQFDAVWVCDLQASAWPPVQSRNPFIPAEIQRQWSMPHATPAQDWQRGERLLSSYRRCSGQLIASWCQVLEGVAEVPSPLLRDIPERLLEPTATLSAAWLAQRRQASCEQLSDHIAPPVVDGDAARERGGVSVIAQQSQCPFRAFALQRLLLEEADTAEAGMPSSLRGTLLHTVLQKLLGTLNTRDRIRESIANGSAAELIDAALDEACRQHSRTGFDAVSAAALQLEKARLARLLLDFLQLEAERPDFQVLAREAEATLALDGLQLTLRIDRTDLLADGSTQLVVDYKSGKANPGAWKSARPQQPQLPLYALALESPPGGVAFAQINRDEVALKGLGTELASEVAGVSADVVKTSGRRAQDWAGQLALWQRDLTQLAQDFLGGAAAVDPLQTACRFCTLQPVCRVQQDVDTISEGSEGAP